MSSLYSVFSAFLCSVASATYLSREAIPASSLAISSFVVPIASVVVAMAVSWSATLRSSAFFLSSERSNWVPQYSFLLSSSNCSFLSTSTMSSIIPTIFSKPPWVRAFLPLSASTRRSNPARCLRLEDVCILRSVPRARERREAAVTSSCTKLAALGKVFLKSSRASSSFKTLMVSASATSSSARVFERSSHSLSFLAQLASRFPRNFLSSARVAWVSSRSSFICTTSTPTSPICSDLVSMDCVSAPTSLVLAAMSSSKDLIAASSVAVASARPLAIVSPICFRIPVI
mmetsp:Transcript_57430/g.170910  ORF Transcript_57430/g.170910 Transcript_57430/m.170910 type:complete len:288 (-) Transcript_57430:456-1319(-)